MSTGHPSLQITSAKPAHYIKRSPQVVRWEASSYSSIFPLLSCPVVVVIVTVLSRDRLGILLASCSASAAFRWTL